MQENCVRVMVDGNGHRSATSQLNSCRCTAASGEVVNDDLFEKIRLFHDSSSNSDICPGHSPGGVSQPTPI